MRIITLNMHSMTEVREISMSWRERFSVIAEKFIKEQYDIIALQEVNQLVTEAPVASEELQKSGYVGADCGEIIRKGNAAHELAKQLNKNQAFYKWSYCVSHLGYDIFEEGTAIFSRFPVERSFVLDVSRREEKGKWTYRRQTGLEINCDDKRTIFLSVHFGWWEGRENSEGFSSQWERMIRRLQEMQKDRVFIMGDLNNADTVRSEGYDLVTGKYGFFDSYLLADKKPQKGATMMTAAIDGWENTVGNANRLDYIMVSDRIGVTVYRNVFDGKNGDIVSDHFGVEIAWDEKMNGTGQVPVMIEKQDKL